MNESVLLVDKLYDHIKNNYSTSPLMINISGCTGAGKSTWAESIANSFKNDGLTVSHISEDDFLQPRAYRSDLREILYETGKWKGRTYWEIHENWLRLDLMRQVILNLSHKKTSAYHPYRRDLGTFASQEKTVEPSQVVVFETSVFSELFEVVILIEVNNKNLLNRKLSRDNDLRNEQMIRKYHEVQFSFWQRHKPSKAQYIIDNNDIQNPKLKIV